MLPTRAELEEHLSFFDDWTERYRYIIDLGKKLEPLRDVDKNDVNKVNGCMSQVWLTADSDGDKLIFRGDSDATIVRGLIAVLLSAYSGQKSRDILAFDLDAYFDRLGLAGHLSPNRRNGFFAMVERIKKTAEAHMAQAPK